MQCSLCFCHVKDYYLKCHICQNTVCEECYKENEQVECPTCKKLFNVFMNYPNIRSVENFLSLYIAKKRKIVNESLKRIRAVINGICAQVKDEDKETLKQFKAITKSLREVVNNEYNLNLQQEWKRLARKCKNYEHEGKEEVKKEISDYFSEEYPELDHLPKHWEEEVEEELEPNVFVQNIEYARNYARKLQIKTHFKE